VDDEIHRNFHEIPRNILSFDDAIPRKLSAIPTYPQTG